MDKNNHYLNLILKGWPIQIYLPVLLLYHIPGLKHQLFMIFKLLFIKGTILSYQNWLLLKDWEASFHSTYKQLALNKLRNCSIDH